MLRWAVYGGSFDPITIGHLSIIQQASRIFDSVAVCIGQNPAKKPMFSELEREQMIREVLEDRNLKNCHVSVFRDQYLVDYATECSCGFMIRGIRNQNDFHSEQTIRNINSDLNPAIIPVFLMPKREHCEISSSMVKGMVGPKGWETALEKYTFPNVIAALKRKMQS